ncbi:4a-hydroxytetrahydrobiopterin dehydratase [Paenibacillus ginsengarvi]|uniref:4a-hydroxytetrahydrobiopterin dehydratase n=1 Tax=Paenibacillus ginsengarvi TaxID=400777 RepID=A0A3B0CMV2_9BACL|nr:4a-hydroxytetrahydrobiopterin dehydratase [Paenibacillus ginsengarvi]RKN86723.1 4a-hydroxytetrahydrobiopterin dehydratase [Paenibacillus ginsengarvi]
MTKLTDEQIQELLHVRQGWTRKDSKWLVKKYRFQQFMKGIEFVQQTAMTAEALNHHPMIAIEYKVVTISVTTWSEGGITALDFELIDRCDRLFQTMCGTN